jgi:hypothetical protein
MKSRIRVSTTISGVTTATVVVSTGDAVVSRVERLNVGVGSSNIKGQLLAAHQRAVLTLGSVDLAVAEINEEAE